MTSSKTRIFIFWGLTVPLITYWGAKYTDVSFRKGGKGTRCLVGKQASKKEERVKGGLLNDRPSLDV
jgi:hypothetical protein